VQRPKDAVSVKQRPLYGCKRVSNIFIDLSKLLAGYRDLTRGNDAAGINIDDALAGEMAEEQPQKYVFKLLQKEDINRALVGRQVSAKCWVWLNSPPGYPS
jgi:hypothetical protein